MYAPARSTLFFRLYKACLNFLRQCDTPRNLPTVWSAILRLDNSDDLREQGKAKREATQGRPSKEKLLSENDNSLPPHDTRAIIAAEVGVSTGYIGGVQSKYPHAHGSNLPE